MSIIPSRPSLSSFLRIYVPKGTISHSYSHTYVNRVSAGAPPTPRQLDPATGVAKEREAGPPIPTGKTSSPRPAAGAAAAASGTGVPGGGGPEEEVLRPFSRKFVFALDEFIDRLEGKKYCCACVRVLFGSGGGLNSALWVDFC